MNKHQITTILENGKYVGIITKADEIVFKTPPQDTPNDASALMTKYINEASTGSPTTITPQPLPGVSTQPSIHSIPSAGPVARKCCGRG